MPTCKFARLLFFCIFAEMFSFRQKVSGMKKLIVFLILIFASLCGFAENESLLVPNQEYSGDTILITYITCCDGSIFNFPLCENGFCFLADPISSISNMSYNCNGIHYYAECDFINFQINVGHDTVLNCCIDSVNNMPLTSIHKIVITVHHAHAITIPQDSIRHVTCPNGYLHPYGDGAFHVDLVDSVQDYSSIKVRSDSSFFFVHTYHDAFTVEGLRGGTYQIEAYGTNGCAYRDSVVIEHPEAWYSNADSSRKDTVCLGQLGCNSISICGGTPPYSFTWFYYSDTGQVFMSDTTRMVCGLSSGIIYCVYMYDSRGCKAWGEETDFIIVYLYEYVEDSTHIITTDPMACYGQEFLVQAQSIGYGNYTWHVGDVEDSVNYSTWVAEDSVLIAEYHTPPMTEASWVSVDFADQHGCVTHDSVWVEINHPVVDLVNTPDNLCSNGDYPLDVSAYTVTTPTGGTLYYYGAGLTENGLFSPASAGAYEIHTVYTDPYGCTTQDSATVHIMDPEPIVLTIDTLMFTDSLYYIQAPAGGTMLLGETLLSETNEGYVLDASQYEPGYYTLRYEVIIGEYNCLSEYETVIHFVTSTKIRDFNQEISVYPNPATATLNLSGTETMDFTATITDIMGKVIRTERILNSQHSIDVSGLSSGIYLLRLQTLSGATKTVKFVKR